MGQQDRDAEHTAAPRPAQPPARGEQRHSCPSTGVRISRKRTSKHLPATLSDSAPTPARGRAVGQARTLQRGPLSAACSAPCC